MSDTPRTDAVGPFFTPHHCGYETLCRQLERELKEAKVEIDRLREGWINSDKIALEARIREAAIESKWDDLQLFREG